MFHLPVFNSIFEQTKNEITKEDFIKPDPKEIRYNGMKVNLIIIINWVVIMEFFKNKINEIMSTLYSIYKIGFGFVS